jgi:hypothetical protein
MREPSGAPAAADLLFPELVGPSEPAPPARSRASRLLRTLARIALWSLIAAAPFGVEEAAPIITGAIKWGDANFAFAQVRRLRAHIPWSPP